MTSPVPSEDPAQRGACALAQTKGIAAPAPNHLVDELAGVLARELALSASSSTARRPLLRQHDGADARQEALAPRNRAATWLTDYRARPRGFVRRRFAARFAPRRGRGGSAVAVAGPSARWPRRARPPAPRALPPQARALRERRASRATRLPALGVSGSRSLSTTSSGVAMKIVEYAPDVMPTRSAKAKSLSVSPPKRSSDAIGSSVMKDVASDRLIVSHSDWFAIAAKLERRMSGMFAHAVEDDDRVVDGVTEDGQDRRHRGRRHLAPRERVEAERVMRMSCRSATSTGSENWNSKRSVT